MRIKDLATRVANLFSGNAYFVVDNGTKVEKVTSATLAQQTLETYSGSTLAGTAQSVKAAIDELNSKATDADKFTIVRYTGLSSTSTQTIVDLGIFSVYGSAIIFLRVDSIYDGASAYFVRRNSVGYQIIKIHEGTHEQTPIIDSNGVLKLKSYTSGVTVHGAVITLAKWS